MSDQTERMEDALRRVIGEKIAAEGEAERQKRINAGWAETYGELKVEAERLRAALSDAERNLEDAGRWAQQAELATTQIRKTADAYKKYRALADTEAEATK